MLWKSVAKSPSVHVSFLKGYNLWFAKGFWLCAQEESVSSCFLATLRD
jgi:hypothetical protein